MLPLFCVVCFIEYYTLSAGKGLLVYTTIEIFFESIRFYLQKRVPSCFRVRSYERLKL